MPGYVYSLPQYASKAEWDVGMGLQAVDGLEVSSFLKDLAIENIEGRLDFNAIARLLEKQRREYAYDEAEADAVSSRIAEILASQGFSCKPPALQAIHRQLFEDVFPFAGEYRTVNVSKPEPVLNGRSVSYALRGEISFNLNYDFKRENEEPYCRDKDRTLKRLCSFTRAIWQTHPFAEGNTRTTAVFMAKYLRSKGFKVDNSLFAENAMYFRNALVRASYGDYSLDIREDPSYLASFYDNMLFGGKHELRSRDLVCLKLFVKEDEAAGTESEAQDDSSMSVFAAFQQWR